MFATTFLGHQGWLFQTDKAAVLVDPLLAEDFGAAHALEYRVWPPRVFEFSHFPRIDALVLTHEHDDHFDLPSLAKLDRAIPVYLSARSSRAARQILAEMGFSVHAFVPGGALRFGDLEVRGFAGDHIGVNCGDEWDTLPFLVRSTDGHGSMFSMVDIPLTQRHVEWAAAHAMKPGLIGWTNNALDWSHMADHLKERVEGTQQCFVKMGMGHKMITQTWGTPQAMITCAGGFAFTGERAWMNQRVFCVDTEQVCALIGNVYKKEKFYCGAPGQTWVMKGGRLAEVRPTAPWLGTAPKETWPSRAKAQVAVADYAPATGARELDDAGLARLRADLDEFAGVLVGGTVFRGLASLIESEHEGRRGTFAFALRRAGERVILEYDATTCSFVDAPAGVVAAEAAYVAGLECWAADLAAVLAGRLGPIALTFGRSRVWNALPQRFSFDIFDELNRTSHPLRRPAAYLDTYRRLYAPAKDTEHVVLKR